MGTPQTSQTPQPVETPEERTARRTQENAALNGRYEEGVRSLKEQIENYFPECEWRNNNLYLTVAQLQAATGLSAEEVRNGHVLEELHRTNCP